MKRDKEHRMDMDQGSECVTEDTVDQLLSTVSTDEGIFQEMDEETSYEKSATTVKVYIKTSSQVTSASQVTFGSEAVYGTSEIVSTMANGGSNQTGSKPAPSVAPPVAPPTAPLPSPTASSTSDPKSEVKVSTKSTITSAIVSAASTPSGALKITIIPNEDEARSDLKNQTIVPPPPPPPPPSSSLLTSDSGSNIADSLRSEVDQSDLKCKLLKKTLKNGVPAFIPPIFNTPPPDSDQNIKPSEYLKKVALEPVRVARDSSSAPGSSAPGSSAPGSSAPGSSASGSSAPGSSASGSSASGLFQKSRPVSQVKVSQVKSTMARFLANGMERKTTLMKRSVSETHLNHDHQEGTETMTNGSFKEESMNESGVDETKEEGDGTKEEGDETKEEGDGTKEEGDEIIISVSAKSNSVKSFLFQANEHDTSRSPSVIPPSVSMTTKNDTSRSPSVIPPSVSMATKNGTQSVSVPTKAATSIGMQSSKVSGHNSNEKEEVKHMETESNVSKSEDEEVPKFKVALKPVQSQGKIDDVQFLALKFEKFPIRNFWRQNSFLVNFFH